MCPGEASWRQLEQCAPWVDESLVDWVDFFGTASWAGCRPGWTGWNGWDSLDQPGGTWNADVHITLHLPEETLDKQSMELSESIPDALKTKLEPKWQCRIQNKRRWIGNLDINNIRQHNLHNGKINLFI